LHRFEYEYRDAEYEYRFTEYEWEAIQVDGSRRASIDILPRYNQPPGLTGRGDFMQQLLAKILGSSCAIRRLFEIGR
jgi:hypothetical protein